VLSRASVSTRLPFTCAEPRKLSRGVVRCRFVQSMSVAGTKQHNLTTQWFYFTWCLSMLPLTWSDRKYDITSVTHNVLHCDDNNYDNELIMNYNSSEHIYDNGLWIRLPVVWVWVYLENHCLTTLVQIGRCCWDIFSSCSEERRVTRVNITETHSRALGSVQKFDAIC